MSNVIVSFTSNAHQRFENGKPVMGHQSCGRLITVEHNITGCSGYQLAPGDGYIVRMHNLDVDKPNMSPKPMRLLYKNDREIELRGYPVQAMTPFGWDNFDLSDYGMTLVLEGTKVKQCTLHMLDRNVDIEYYIENASYPQINVAEFDEGGRGELTEVEVYAQQSIQQLKVGNESGAYSSCVNCYTELKYSPEILKDVQDYESVGISLLTLLSFGRIDDIDIQQRIASISYLFLSKGIEKDPNNVNLYKCRFLLLNRYHEPFQYTVMDALQLNAGYGFLSSISMGMSSFRARDAMYAMKYADLQDCPMLTRIDNTFVQVERYLNQKISNGFFSANENRQTFAEKGRKNHRKLLEYLDDMVLKNADIDF